MNQRPQSFIMRAVNALNTLAVIQKIYNAVKSKYGNSLDIAYPQIASDKNRIYFIIDSSNFDIVSLKGEIKDILGFDYSEDDDGKQDVIILNAQCVTHPSYIASLANDITPFSPQTIKNVQEFLLRHYEQYLEKPKNIKNSVSADTKEKKNGECDFWKKDKVNVSSTDKHQPHHTSMNATEARPPKPVKPAV